MTEQRYRIDLRYDGRPFQGWQSQPDGSGVQDHLEKALKTFLRHEVRVTGASRTDSGVHAEHQVATFSTSAAFDERRWRRSLDGILPAEIGVRALAPVTPEFHPILSGKGKAYRYRLYSAPNRHPFGAPFAWHLPPRLDVESLRREAVAFAGTHDFTSFCAADSSAKTRDRTIFEMAVFSQGPLTEVWVIGNGFLKQMVRSIVGTLVDIAEGREKAGAIPGILAAKDRRVAGQSAPAQGLCLVEIFYERVRTAEELKNEAAMGFTFGV